CQAIAVVFCWLFRAPAALLVRLHSGAMRTNQCLAGTQNSGALYRHLIPDRVLGVLVCTTATTNSEWLEFNAGCREGTSPVVRYGETSTDRISFDVELSGLLAELVEYDSDVYLRFYGSPGTTPLDKTG
ncbi:MAG: hypothetical protein KAR40_17995, partial [Candidatus Sabulitectum sp.]|nr:hypothetical protein [Candidatus Sabulitectum sp.]